ncbi:hypothetical protein [Solwaraspora sp. WMMA2065]|uniref:hypothetical protein n=1 Tax=Solwaraspora sp. WMMA2065 TaxID=3015166 RepID=UPI00259B24EE|nr:hypothetical protein [Solwaraspora sp. WMMA2065]WJK33088.1 hypothetical protein O7610_20510 [Solwaraspora sp. WMMA2065]
MLDQPVDAGNFWRALASPGAVMWSCCSLLAVPSAWLPSDGRAGTWSSLPVSVASWAAGLLTAAGLAQLLAHLVRRIWLGYYIPWPLSKALRDRRVQRWTTAGNAARSSGQGSPQRERLLQRQVRIALAYPTSPTWIGDRFAALRTRVDNQYELDLPSAWPRLLLLLPVPVRKNIGDAGRRFDAAVLLQAWALVNAPLGLLWWPVSCVAGAAALAAALMGRSAAAQATDLIEAAVDVYGHRLIGQLGPSETATILDGRVSARLNARHRKSA